MGEFDYKPNSNAFKEEQKKNALLEKKRVKTVVNGTATTRKNDMRKLTDVFISEDVKNVKRYVFMDVLVPTIKNAIVDIITNGVNMIFFGETGARKTKSSSSYVSYASRFDKRDEPRSHVTTRNRFDYDDIVVSTRGEAEAIFSQMEEVIDRYGVVTVLDLYDMVELTAPHTSDKYGWTSIQGAKAVPIRNGYVLKLPKAAPIDY